MCDPEVINPYNAFYITIVKELKKLCKYRNKYVKTILPTYYPILDGRDELLLDEFYFELSRINEHIDKLKGDYYNWKNKFKNFNDELYESYLKFKLHPKRVLRILVENNLEFWEKPFDELLFEDDYCSYSNKQLHFIEEDVEDVQDV